MERSLTSDSAAVPKKRRQLRRRALILCGVLLLTLIGVYWLRESPRRRAITTLTQGQAVCYFSRDRAEWMSVCDWLFGVENAEPWYQPLLPIDRVHIYRSLREDGSMMEHGDLAGMIRSLQHLPEVAELHIYWNSSDSLRNSSESVPGEELKSACRVFHHLSQLETVYMSSAPVDDECLRWLANCPKLTHLSVWDAPVTGTMFEQPWKSTGILWSIELLDTRFDHKHIRALRQFQDLHVLMCSDFRYCECEYCEAERVHQPKLWEGYEFLEE